MTTAVQSTNSQLSGLMQIVLLIPGAVRYVKKSKGLASASARQ